ncbi:MAG: SEC-C metal-binding domain-containing protein, partial [Candidatus Eremiobacterota bacterium]
MIRDARLSDYPRAGQVSQALVSELLPRLSGPEQVRQALELAREGPDPVLMAGVLLAARMGCVRHEASPALLGWLVPRLKDIPLVSALAGCWPREQALHSLLELLQLHGWAPGLRFMPLLTACTLAEGQPPSPVLIREWRLQYRCRQSPSAWIALLAAADLLCSDRIQAELGPAYPVLSEAARRLVAFVRSHLEGNFYYDLPATDWDGHTFRRSQTRVGRNQPCPCGSGRKYKNCCLDTVTFAARPGPEEENLKPENLSSLAIQDLIRLDLARLSTGTLQEWTRFLSSFGFWEEVERGRQELEHRGAWDEHDWLTLSFEAQAQRSLGHLERALAEIPTDSPHAEETRLTRFLLAHRPVLEELEGELSECLDEPFLRVDAAHTLLRLHPVLGILVARGCLEPGDTFEADSLLDEVVRARILLDLDSRDMLADWLEQAGMDEEEESGEEEDSQAAELNRRLGESTREVKELRRQLEAAQEQLKSRVREKSGEFPAVAARPSGVPEDPEVRRLRNKVRELKQLVTERNRERADWRRQMRESPATAVTPEPPASVVAGDPEEEAGAELPQEVTRRRPLVPEFHRDAGSELEQLPDRLARQA